MIAAIEAFFGTTLGRWLVVGALVAAALFAGGVYERDIGYREGLNVGAKQLAEQAKANADAVIALNARYRADEAKQRDQMVQLGIDYANSLKQSEEQASQDVAAAKSGALKLRIPAHCPTASSVVSSPPAPSTGSNGPETVELPGEVTSRLYSLADDADTIVAQLSACQTVITSYLKGTQ